MEIYSYAYEFNAFLINQIYRINNFWYYLCEILPSNLPRAISAPIMFIGPIAQDWKYCNIEKQDCSLKFFEIDFKRMVIKCLL